MQQEEQELALLPAGLAVPAAETVGGAGGGLLKRKRKWKVHPLALQQQRCLWAVESETCDAAAEEMELHCYCCYCY